MRYAGINKNDFASAPGTCVTVYLQGCDKHCKGCHNPETWDFCGGKEFTNDTLDEIIQALTTNTVARDLCIMGGEPLHAENSFLTYMIIDMVLRALPNTKIYLWTGYYLDELKLLPGWIRIKQILERCEMLVDGPYEEENRDITLFMRGSTNQTIYNKEQLLDFINKL